MYMWSRPAGFVLGKCNIHHSMTDLMFMGHLNWNSTGINYFIYLSTSSKYIFIALPQQDKLN